MPGWGTSPGEEGTAAHSSILPWRIPEGSLVGYSPWGLRDSDTVKGLSSHARILNGLTARATAVNNDQLKKKTHKMFSPIDVLAGCKCVSEAGGRNVANKEKHDPLGALGPLSDSLHSPLSHNRDGTWEDREVQACVPGKALSHTFART